MSSVVCVDSISRVGSDDLYWKASGTCDNKRFEATSILHKGQPIFKIDNAGRILDGLWSRGERASVARACRDKMLSETGHVIPARKKVRSRKRKSIFTRTGRRVPGVEYHHSGLPMNSSISALKRSR